jgi:hypothetical protein
MDGLVYEGDNCSIPWRHIDAVAIARCEGVRCRHNHSYTVQIEQRAYEQTNPPPICLATLCLVPQPLYYTMTDIADIYR